VQGKEAAHWISSLPEEQGLPLSRDIYCSGCTAAVDKCIETKQGYRQISRPPVLHPG